MVAVRKDYAPAATQATITNVAGVISLSEGGGAGLPWVDASNALIVTTGVDFAGASVRKQQPGADRSRWPDRCGAAEASRT